jgi:hypothetical protein
MRCYNIECREHDLNIQLPVTGQIVEEGPRQAEPVAVDLIAPREVIWQRRGAAHRHLSGL